MTIRPITPEDIPWVKQVFKSLNFSWQEGLLGFVAEEEERKVGLITYQIFSHPEPIRQAQGKLREGSSAVISSSLSLRADGLSEAKDLDSSPAKQAQNDNEFECEIMSLNSLTPGKGIGFAIFEKVMEKAKEKGCKKIIVAQSPMTNDFFKKQGFTITGEYLEKILNRL